MAGKYLGSLMSILVFYEKLSHSSSCMTIILLLRNTKGHLSMFKEDITGQMTCPEVAGM